MNQADLVFRNARILDGSGTPAVVGDVSVLAGRIERVGQAGAGAIEIDAGGSVLCPGFIDTHAHDDAALLMHPGMEFKLAQGCTTVVVGNCGFSAAPAIPGRSLPPGSSSIFPGLAPTRREEGSSEDLSSFFEAVEAGRPAINAAALVGHNTIRALVLGDQARAPTTSELDEMRSYVEAALEQGACGLSSGLIYRPGRYAATEELVLLCGPVSAYGALYATHLRDEADGLLASVEEALHIGKQAQCGVHLSHHKWIGERNWGRIGQSLALVDRANREGGDVTLDVYPYTMGSGPMIEYFDLDRPDLERARAMRIASCPAFPEWEGLELVTIAEREGIGLAELVRQILTAPRGEQTISIQLIVSEADIETNLRHPRTMIGTDGIANLTGKPHPRLFGTMPRILGEYVRERRVLTLEAAIHKLTGLAAERFGLVGRGFVREGCFADLVLFDPELITDAATYDDPKREPFGIRVVVVNGKISYRDGRPTEAGAGRALPHRREPESKPET